MHQCKRSGRPPGNASHPDAAPRERQFSCMDYLRSRTVCGRVLKQMFDSDRSTSRTSSPAGPPSAAQRRVAHSSQPIMKHECRCSKAVSPYDLRLPNADSTGRQGNYRDDIELKYGPANDMRRTSTGSALLKLSVDRLRRHAWQRRRSLIRHRSSRRWSSLTLSAALLHSTPTPHPLDATFCA